MTREQATELVEALLNTEYYHRVMWEDIDYDNHPDLIEFRDKSRNELFWLKEQVIHSLTLIGDRDESR